MDLNSAVFIQSKTDLVDVISACRQFLQRKESQTELIGIFKVAAYGGYKVYFNDSAVVCTLLRRRFLYDSIDRAAIYPAETVLFVKRTVSQVPAENFKKELTAWLRQYCNVINVTSVSGSENWKVVLDIPEIAELDVFKTFVLRDVPIPLPNTDERLLINFYCLRCAKVDHTQFCCPANFHDEASVVSSTLPSTNPEDVTPQITTEEVQKALDLIKHHLGSVIGREEVNRYNSSVSDLIKEEPTESIPENGASGNHQGRPRADGVAKKSFQNRRQKDSPAKINKNGNRTIGQPHPIATSSQPSCLVPSADDDCIVLTDDDDDESEYPSTEMKSEYPSTEENDSESENQEHQTNPRSPKKLTGTPRKSSTFEKQISTSVPCPGDWEGSRSSFDERDPSNQCLDNINASDDNYPTASTSKSRRKPNLSQPMVIPHRIRRIIESKAPKPLNVAALEAFFNHSKKKSRPCEIAKNFCSNANELKNQLETIRKEYYRSRDPITKDGVQFMKWFEGMLDRFDRPTSSKRS